MKVKMLTIILLALMILYSISGCEKKEIKGVSKEVIEQLLRDIYTPKSLDEFYEAKERYVSEGLITQDLAEAMFTVSDGVTELDEKDLARKLSIDTIQFSDTSNNSVKNDLYKVTMRLEYDGTITRAEIIFSVNGSGQIYKRDVNILDN